MADSIVLQLRLAVAVFGAYLVWRSARGWLERRRSHGESRPVDRVWRFFIFFMALTVFFLLGVPLAVGIGVPLVVFDAMALGGVVSLLGLGVCGFLVGWYSHGE